jgi:hypothetical protein
MSIVLFLYERRELARVYDGRRVSTSQITLYEAMIAQTSWKTPMCPKGTDRAAGIVWPTMACAPRPICLSATRQIAEHLIAPGVS